MSAQTVRLNFLNSFWTSREQLACCLHDDINCFEYSEARLHQCIMAKQPANQNRTSVLAYDGICPITEDAMRADLSSQYAGV
jgi:hypothetical protein